MDKQKNRSLSLVISLAVIAVLTAIDQYTKYLASSNLKGQDNIILIKGVFELEYLENRGAAFGILQNQQWLFIILFILFVIIVSVLYVRMPQDQRYYPVRIIALMIISGGIGNLIDRVRLGYVVDFFYFSLIDFPIFNVADIYVTVSMVVLFILFIFYYKEEDFDILFSLKKKV